MKHVTIEQELLAIRSKQGENKAFIANTMRSIHTQATERIFERELQVPHVSKRGRLIARFRQLPRTMAIGSIIAALAVSGTAYAAYQLWLKPTATVQSSNQNQTLIKLRNCMEYGGNTDLHVVINKNSGLSPGDAAKYVQANCEIDAVQSWAMATLQGKLKEASDILFPYSIQSVHGNTTKLHDESDWRTIQVNSHTLYVANGNYTSKEAIAPGDTVAYVVDEKSSSTIRAVIKLDLPFKYYASNQNAYFTREPCSGDPRAWCGSPGSLDVIPSGEVGANPSATGNRYEIQGVLVSHSPTGFLIRDTAGSLHTISTNGDVIASFNAHNGYGPITIEPDDVLDIMYRQPQAADHSLVRANQVEDVQLLMAQVGKQWDTATNSQKYHY